MQKFGVRIFEGYGTTETSPVISVNTPMFYKNGTVGRLLPQIDYRLEKTPGVTAGGRLFIKGDNVMMGYIKADKPEILQKADEWYDTGDIIEIDEDGFLHINGRAKRFAKIGGGMVSLTAVEQAIDEIYTDAKQGVIAVADDKKGEKLVLITNVEKADIQDLQKHFRTQGLSELWIPKEVVYFKNPPLLGSGKFDYIAAEEMYKTM